MRILCMGKITYDYSLPIDGFPIEGLKYDLKEKVENSGGGACNAAYLLSKWNEEVYLSAAVGGDELGTRIRKDFDDLGIKTHTIETVFEAKTPIEFILINKNTGNKTIFSIAEKEPHVKKYEFDFVPELIYLDGYEYTAGVSVVNKYPNAITVLDAAEYNKPTVELCRYCKHIIASQSFVESFTGIKADFTNPTTLLEMYKKFAAKYPNNNVVVTLKDHGAMYLDNNQIKVMPGLKLDSIKDATGAGDIFRAAYVAGLSRGYELEKIIRIANIASGLSLKTIGAKESVPLFSDVASYYESKFGSIDASVANAQQAQTEQVEVSADVKVEEAKVENTETPKEETSIESTPQLTETPVEVTAEKEPEAVEVSIETPVEETVETIQTSEPQTVSITPDTQEETNDSTQEVS